ncbi:glycoside hydrolase family 6 protein [Streptomyces radicis]|uniref:Glucanase n=1 Tax=Streptomyces radicis TaxID=1750517 RepID=A0A3A9W8A8_9ACTN|nr:glycoside hydrolase family 6 protein [Streptomyces radicis]RKN09338.1 endoglucanase [Streptomyces radicis]RKN23064.1 endoglucanase [Streptomyces radicis]
MYGPLRRVTRLGSLSVALLGVLALGCSSGGEGSPRGQGGEASGAAGEESGTFWVDPESPAARQVREWEDEGRADDAALVRRIAEQPLATWPPGDEDPAPRVRAVVDAATDAGRTAVLVAYNIPHRDCGRYSRGGAADGAAYERWIGSFAGAIGDAEAVVVLEPDAVPHTADGCTDPRYVDERFQLLAAAVDALKAGPRTRVYLDAGNPGWITDPDRLAEALGRAGVARADGFALNVANFETLDASTAYGRDLSGLLGGAHFVVDTSRNGNGPFEGDAEPWCNPPGRALGTPPTTDTGDPLVDAFLWVKRPGESDGECRGGPPAGRWWPAYALGLARDSG